MIDTQAIVWTLNDSKKLSGAAREIITSGVEEIYISAVTAFEFVGLNRRGRFEVDLPFRSVLQQLEAIVLDYPASAWTIAEALPEIQFDPVDRMLVAHAIHADLTLLTADRKMRECPVRCVW